MKPLSLTLIAALTTTAANAEAHLTYGPRPAFSVEKMDDSPLKIKLQSFAAQSPARSDFSIGHRGAPLMFTEHTVESNVAAAQLGAGILECEIHARTEIPVGRDAL